MKDHRAVHLSVQSKGLSVWISIFWARFVGPKLLWSSTVAKAYPSHAVLLFLWPCQIWNITEATGMVLDLIPYSKCNWDGSRLSFLRHCLLIIYSLILRMIRCFMTLIGIGYRFCASLSPYLTEMIVLPFYAPRSSYMYCMLLVPINLYE